MPTSHNPYSAPENPETPQVLMPQSMSPTPLFRWLMVIVVFEFVLSPLSLAAEFWPVHFENLHTYLTCFGVNLGVLAILSWQIGRRMNARVAIILGQLTHITAWLVFIVVNCVLTNWGFRPDEWNSVLIVIGFSAAFNGLLTAIASQWFRLSTTSIRAKVFS